MGKAQINPFLSSGFPGIRFLKTYYNMDTDISIEILNNYSYNNIGILFAHHIKIMVSPFALLSNKDIGNREDRSTRTDRKISCSNITIILRKII